MPNQPATKNKAFRAHHWDEFGDATEAMGTNRSVVLNAYIAYHLGLPGAILPDLPPGHPDMTGDQIPPPVELVTEPAIEAGLEAVEGQAAWDTAAADPSARRLLVHLALQAAAPLIGTAARTVARARPRRTPSAGS
jgi:hypothetical protein